MFRSTKFNKLEVQGMKKTTPMNIIIKLVKISYKDKILKTTREKGHIYTEGKKVRVTAGFSLERMQTRRQWSSILIDLN